MLEFNTLEEMQPYYDKKSNTYIFKNEVGSLQDVKFSFNLDINSNINAWNIDALNIKTGDIKACNIDSIDISRRM